MVVQHNLTAFNSNRMLGLTSTTLAKTTEKLSSGYKVNRAADDAAGLAISEKMRRQIRGLTQASKNCQDGVSFCQIADGALNEVHDMLKRCHELATQASNETNTDTDRDFINQEVQALSAEIDRVHETSVFNELRVFTDAGLVPGTDGSIPNSMISIDGDYNISVGNINITFEVIDVNGDKISSPNDVAASGTANPDEIANSSLAQFTKKAAADAVANLASLYPSLFSKASTGDIKIGLELSPQSAGGMLATANLSMSSLGDDSVMSYKMWVDTKDYPIDSFDSKSDAEKADLAAVVAHEMTHLVMYDTVTKGMLGGLPDWFVEGMAQTSSGDNGWLSNRLNPSSTDDQIKTYKSQMATMPYGAGYAATMYLGYVAGDGTSASDVNSGTIARGLDKILSEMADGKTFDEAIASATNNKFSGASDFQSKFTSSSDNNSLAFMKNFLNARGTSGGGSLFGPLSTSEADNFKPSTLTGGYSSYTIETDNQWYSNQYGTGIPIPQNLPSSGGGGTGEGNDKNGFVIQAGAEAGQYIYIKKFNASAKALFGNQTMDVSTVGGAQATMDLVKAADARVSGIRSYYGATQNRLEHTIANLDNVVENTTAAESQIRDTDMAEYMVKCANLNILQQAGQSMLAQSNQKQEMVLSLLS